MAFYVGLGSRRKGKGVRQEIKLDIPLVFNTIVENEAFLLKNKKNIGELPDWLRGKLGDRLNATDRTLTSFFSKINQVDLLWVYRVINRHDALRKHIYENVQGWQWSTFDYATRNPFNFIKMLTVLYELAGVNVRFILNSFAENAIPFLNDNTINGLKKRCKWFIDNQDGHRDTEPRLFKDRYPKLNTTFRNLNTYLASLNNLDPKQISEKIGNEEALWDYINNKVRDGTRRIFEYAKNRPHEFLVALTVIYELSGANTRLILNTLAPGEVSLFRNDEKIGFRQIATWFFENEDELEAYISIFLRGEERLSASVKSFLKEYKPKLRVKFHSLREYLTMLGHVEPEEVSKIIEDYAELEKYLKAKMPPRWKKTLEYAKTHPDSFIQAVENLRDARVGNEKRRAREAEALREMHIKVKEDFVSYLIELAPDGYKDRGEAEKYAGYASFLWGLNEKIITTDMLEESCRKLNVSGCTTDFIEDLLRKKILKKLRREGRYRLSCELTLYLANNKTKLPNIHCEIGP